MTPSIYINLEDDVSKIVSRLKHNPGKQVVLVCPKRCYLFNDSINLRLLKKQTDLLKKEIFILTMDERGQLYAKEAGFQLKFLPKAGGSKAMSDIQRPQKQSGEQASGMAGPIAATVSEIKNFAHKLMPESRPAAAPRVLRKSPPNVINSSLSGKKLEITETLFPKELEAEYIRPQNNRKSASGKIAVGILTLSIALAGLLYFVILPRASVVVYPKTEIVTRDMEIGMSASLQSMDPAKLALPAVKVDETVNLGDKFQSRGKKQVGNKSSGAVQIYNFTKLPINLKAGTTVLMAGSRNYQLAADVQGVRPTTYKNAKTKEIDESSLGPTVDVVAASGGEDYNLPAGTRMEITNQVFGSKPQLLYAKTATEISGGTTRYLSVISQEDIDAAKAQLTAGSLEEIRAKLTNTGLTLPEKSYIFDVSSFATDNPVGTETANFNANLQAKLSGLAFKTDDLNNLINQRIVQTLAANKSLVISKENPLIVKVKGFDLNTQVAQLTVHFEGKAVYSINLAGFASQLTGKTQTEVNELLRSKADIDKVEITLAPAWQKNFPLFAGKIGLTIASVGEDK